MNLGTAQVGGQLAGEVTFTNNGPKNLSVGAVRAPVAPFDATDLPAVGTIIRPHETITAKVGFRSATAGNFTDSLGLTTQAGETDIPLSASAAAPPESGGAQTTASLTPAPAPGPAVISLNEPPASLAHLKIRSPLSSHGRRRHEAQLSFTLSGRATVYITIERKVTSHRCKDGVHTCTRYVPTKLKLKLEGHAGKNIFVLNLARLSAGEYRLAATTTALSGARGVTRSVIFKAVR